MGRKTRIVLVSTAALAVVLAVAWSWLTARETLPTESSYRIDVGALRALAASLPGPGPREIRSVLVAEVALPRGVIFAGEPFEPHRQVHQVFQLVWPDRTLLIDSAFPPEDFAKIDANGGGGGTYHAGGWAALERALPRAEQVVVTHEHYDHLAGAGTLEPEQAPRLRLNPAQLANTKALDDAEISAALRAQLQPLSDEPALAIAPGVVLQAAPGHTPGSQLVYVRREDGREALFLGDVAWDQDQITNLHYRPRLVTLLIGEDRAQVMDQLRALHDLAAAEPGLVQIVSHDESQRSALVTSGVLTEGLAE
ncbi:MAG: MBL fold metallo-hydrolase [Myxococcota bacterium]